jgi:hypothetical protein
VQSCTNYQGVKLISHTMKIDYEGDFLDKATYGEIYGAKERPTYDLYSPGEDL